MGFDLDALRAAVAREPRVVRVVVADLRGSSPREVGAAMLVWDGGQSGTIGGGALEYEAAAAARAQSAGRVLSRHALGPELGQCCGGAVTLLSEVYDAAAVVALRGPVIARPVVAGSSSEAPLSVRRLMAQGRGQGVAPQPQMMMGWMIEPVYQPSRQVWVWGAGHVGRAIVSVLAPVPDIAITWVDTGAERFPAEIPEGVTVLPALNPSDLVAYAPALGEHLILTYSHALDLDLCHRLLERGFGYAGLIGSATKWARFRKRLAALGHRPDQIAQITSPIGDPGLGKHPQMIAVGVAAAILQPAHAEGRNTTNRKDQSA